MSTYLQYYNENISPKLQKIDLFLKTEQLNTFYPDIISELLEISIKEINNLMKAFEITKIDRVNFFVIMKYGSSEICKLFSRELQRKVPHFYSFNDISYIYQIPLDVVVKAADSAGLKNITQENLFTLFEFIYIKSN